MRRRHDAASLPQALRLHERGLVGVRVVIGNVLAGRIVRIEVGEHIAFCVRRAGRFCAGRGRSGGRCRRAGRRRTCPCLVLGARLRIATACGHRSAPAWKRRHDCSADRVRGFVDCLDFRDGRIAFFVGACRLRLEFDEKAFGAGGEQKDNSAILVGAIFDVVRLAVDEVQRALIHVNVLDAGEAGRDRALGACIDRVTGAEHGHRRVGTCAALGPWRIPPPNRPTPPAIR